MARARTMFWAPRLRSAAPFSWRILDHLLWPASRGVDVDIEALRGGVAAASERRTQRQRQTTDDAMMAMAGSELPCVVEVRPV